MTEITARNVDDEGHEIRWLPFVGALVSAPFIVALFGFWAFYPVFALAFGLPTYVIFGAPLFVLALRWYGPRGWAVLFAGSIANLISYPAIAIVIDPDVAGFITGFGLFFAPVWSLAFVWLYRAFACE